jgi:hypothetical protein
MGCTSTGPDSLRTSAVGAVQNPTVALDASSADGNPRPGQEGHQHHATFQGSSTPQQFSVVRVIEPPDGFRGNLTYSQDEARLWLISLGPPVSKDQPSTLYELDATTGDVLRTAEMPFTGDFGSPVYVDGYLYQGLFQESKMYKIDVTPGANFGKIVDVFDLPTINDLNLQNEEHPYPFIEFGGVTASPSGNIILHADDVAMLITIDKDTGELLDRVPTQKAMGGIASTPMYGETFYVLANSDPRGGYCALEFGTSDRRSPEQKDVSWLIVDGKSGETLASMRRLDSRAFASTVTLVRHELVEDAPYGQFTFLATGEDGILEFEWIPGLNAF